MLAKSALAVITKASAAAITKAPAAVLLGEDAATGSTETAGNVMDQLFNHLDSVLTFSGKMLNFIVANPLYGFLFACSLVPVGIGIVVTIKRASHS